MKRLILLRHAKAVPAGSGEDYARELAPRGLRDAAWAGDHIDDGGWAPGLALVSPARRTHQTYDGMAARLATPPVLKLEPRLYDASAATILDVVAQTSDAVACVVAIGHNPGLATVALRFALAGSSEMRSQLARGFPTAAIAVIALVGSSWADVGEGGAIEALLTPG